MDTTFQDFSIKGFNKSLLKERLIALRKWMSTKDLDAYIIGHHDSFFCEFPPEREQRLYWLTGFSGSMGRAIVTKKDAILFVDGRYTLQAHEQVNTQIFTIKHSIIDTPNSYISQHIQTGQRIGFNPYLISVAHYDALLTQLEKEHKNHAQKMLCHILEDPFEEMWIQRPPPFYGKVYKHDDKYNGCSIKHKKHIICKTMQDEACHYHIISDPTCVAWLCNIRGQDIQHTPIALLRAIISADNEIILFCNKERLAPSFYQELSQDIVCLPENDFNKYIKNLCQTSIKQSISIDKNTLSIAHYCEFAEIANIKKRDWDYCSIPRSIKNETEIKGSHQAHYYDALAMCRFIFWFKEQYKNHKVIHEIDAVKKLESLRRDNDFLKDISFPTIAGSGKNGAIIHYRVDEASNQTIQHDTPLLIDSGGQYLCGTTDITRTIIQSEIRNKEIIESYTYVLKGLIAISRAEFHPETPASELDSLARTVLKTHHRDYDHGTGHGVGSFASVHEGPYAISRQTSLPLKEGVIVSLEPGYYQKEQYGIRLENLAIVRKKNIPNETLSPILYFETLTFVPFEMLLIDWEALTSQERQWLDHYHHYCYEIVKKDLEVTQRQWLHSIIQSQENEKKHPLS